MCLLFRSFPQAQKALNNCLLGNTTIHAITIPESDVQGFLQSMGVQSSAASASSVSSPSLVTSSMGSTHPRGGSLMNPARGNKGGEAAGGWGGAPATSSSSSLFSGGAVWGAPDSSFQQGGSDNSRNTTLNSLLPGDLLGENNM